MKNNLIFLVTVGIVAITFLTSVIIETVNSIAYRENVVKQCTGFIVETVSSIGQLNGNHWDYDITLIKRTANIWVNEDHHYRGRFTITGDPKIIHRKTYGNMIFQPLFHFGRLGGRMFLCATPK